MKLQPLLDRHLYMNPVRICTTAFHHLNGLNTSTFKRNIPLLKQIYQIYLEKNLSN